MAMNEKELIRRAMSALGSRTSKRKKESSAGNLDAARKAGKVGGWPKGKKRKRQKIS